MKGFAGYGADTCEIDPRRTALLAIHWQVDVVDPGGAFGPVFSQAVAESGVILRTSNILQQARLAGCRIIYVNIVYRPGYSGIVQNNALFRRAAVSKGFIQGTRGVEVTDALRPGPADIVIDHSRSSAFFGSDLLTILVGFGIETVAISGIATNVSVDHTARDAMQYGFRTILIEDCCFSSDLPHHDAALVTMRVLCSGVMKGDEFVMLLGKGTDRERSQ